MAEIRINWDSLGWAVRQKRIREGLSQAELSELLGGHPSAPTISRLEAGLAAPTAHNYLALCAFVDERPAGYAKGWTAFRTEINDALQERRAKRKGRRLKHGRVVTE